MTTIGLPLDIFAIEMPTGMRSYLRNYGYNFNKKACEFAVSRMRKNNPATGKSEKIEAMNKDFVDELLKRHGVVLEHNEGHNYVYVANMIKADYWKTSVDDEPHMAKMVKDIIDDADMPGGAVFRKWLATCDEVGIVVDWEELL